MEDGRLVLSAWRHKPEELVRVVFLEVHLALALALEDESGFVLQGTEAQMRATLARHPEIIEPGLVVLHEELPVGVGGVDLYARDACGRYVVVELKRSKATQEAVHQVRRYVEAVQATVTAPVRGILAAPDITQPAMVRLNKAGLEFVKVTALPKISEEALQPSLF
jgi:RecB family endonuclease NucS